MGRGMALPPTPGDKTYLQLTLIQDQQNISWGPGRRAEESCGTGRSFTQALTGSELNRGRTSVHKDRTKERKPQLAGAGRGQEGGGGGVHRMEVLV